jgi:hypothetical protein
MMPKFASEDANRLLARLDRIASTIQAQFQTWGMPQEEAKKLVNALDLTADEIEAAAFGPESLQTRQVEVIAKQAATKQAEVIQKDADEAYMGTFKNPQQPIQIESDEPYMKAYADDQSSAVRNGKSTTGRPLT